MKIGIIGGLLFGGLISCAFFGLCGIILISIGIVCSGIFFYKEKTEEKKINAWRANYPSYKY